MLLLGTTSGKILSYSLNTKRYWEYGFQVSEILLLMVKFLVNILIVRVAISNK
jgi:hypothetical protein